MVTRVGLPFQNHLDTDVACTRHSNARIELRLDFTEITKKGKIGHRETRTHRERETDRENRRQTDENLPIELVGGRENQSKTNTSSSSSSPSFLSPALQLVPPKEVGGLSKKRKRGRKKQNQTESAFPSSLSTYSGFAIGAGAGSGRVVLAVHELPRLLAAALGTREARLENHGRDARNSHHVSNHSHELS